MKFEDLKEYKIKLLRTVYDSHNFKYGDKDDIITIKHCDYYKLGPNILFKMEGYKYGTEFVIGIDCELIDK